MLFLDSTYFQGELYLPNLKYNIPEASGTQKRLQTVGENTLGWFIAKYEPEFMKMLLGSRLYSNFIDGMKEEYPAQVWIDLRDVIFPQGEYNLSPAANYVFYWTLRRGRTQTSMKGEERSISDFAMLAADKNVLVKAWNDMLNPVAAIREFIFDNWDAYKEYANGRGCVCNCGFRPINVWNLL